MSSLKQAVATGAAMHKEATQSKHNGLIGMMHTAAQSGHTATAAPDCVIGESGIEIIKLSKSFYYF